MRIYLTLDYELFSSNIPGTPQRCIIEPMQALSNVADKYGVKFTVFADASYLLRLNQLSNNVPQIDEEFKLIKNNLQDLVATGHDVQLHFHPQWIYTNWDDGEKKWKMDTVHFKLSDMEPDLAKSSFADAKRLLDSIVGYKTTCFRACGYCLETYKDYIQLFTDNGITKDSSVVRYCHVDSPVHKYDYRDIPQEQVYRFSKSIREKDVDGQFLEMSISTFHFNPLAYYLTMRQAKRSYKPGRIYKDGKALPDKQYSKWVILLNQLKPKQVIASLDGNVSQLLPLYYKMALQQSQQDLVICGHPKNATEGSISNLDRFIAQTFADNNFLTLKDI